mmetsp:Transcript_42124/g.63612  ORF Transcript_42124/g.63612 Transcript_42124/m.63612 type:complete len:110 (+) Transcript_42124:226-555(+)
MQPVKDYAPKKWKSVHSIIRKKIILSQYSKFDSRAENCKYHQRLHRSTHFFSMHETTQQFWLDFFYLCPSPFALALYQRLFLHYEGASMFQVHIFALSSLSLAGTLVSS